MTVYLILVVFLFYHRSKASLLECFYLCLVSALLMDLFLLEMELVAEAFSPSFSGLSTYNICITIYLYPQIWYQIA